MNPDFNDLDLHDIFNALTRTTTHRERYTTHRGGTEITKHHITSIPALVMQLVAAEPAGSGEMSGSRTAESRPAARIEALDAAMQIDREAAAWLRRLGHDDPANTLDRHSGNPNPGTGTIACLRKLHSALVQVKACDRLKGRRDDVGIWCCTRHHVEADVYRWWHHARILTGYDTPAWRPDNTCPVCDKRRTLRIKLSASSAVCVECHSLWPPDQIGLLAEHVRWENAEEGAESTGETVAS